MEQRYDEKPQAVFRRATDRRFQAPYHLCFSLEHLRACAELVDWRLSTQDIQILEQLFRDQSTVASDLQQSAGTIRRGWSERGYDFLSLLAGQQVRDRQSASRVALEWGIYQVCSLSSQSGEHRGARDRFPSTKER